MKTNKVIAIVGPTASGKTGVGIKLAQKHNGEIISCDSRQVYRHLDIGTAKPTPSERAAAVHHLVDIVDPDEKYTAAQFRADADSLIDSISSAGELPIIVGGTGFYLRSLVDGLFECPQIPPDIRQPLTEELELCSPPIMHRRLAEVDPVSAAAIHPNDGKRIIRALEVFETVGRPISELRKETTVASNHRFLILSLEHDRTFLYERINSRVDIMIEAGLVDEVKKLKANGYDARYNSMNTIGYREILRMLDGDLTTEAAITLIKKNSRNYAKRQLTWFRHMPNTVWVRPDEKIIEKVSDFLKDES